MEEDLKQILRVESISKKLFGNVDTLSNFENVLNDFSAADDSEVASEDVVQVLLPFPFSIAVHASGNDKVSDSIRFRKTWY